MPRILDLEIGVGWLALRIVGGALLSAATYFLLSYVPSHLPEILGRFAPPEFSSIIVSIVSELINPLLYIVGAVIAVIVFLQIVFRKTKVYGPILILAGLASLAYIYLAFQGGVITLTLPKELAMGLQVSVRVYLVTLMTLAMVPTILTMIKGIIISLRGQK
ncbi:MAG: hypothetical protein ACUVQ5_04595 [Candidatus Methanomethylicaceae archaeon]